MNEVTFGENQFCGPSVLSILTGKSTDYAAQVLSRVSFRQNIKAVTAEELEKAIDLLGFKAINQNVDDMSLFLLFHTLYSNDGMYMVIVPKHVICVEVVQGKVSVCDNHTKSPINGASFARLGQKVLRCYKIEEKPVIIEQSSKIEVTRSMTDSGIRVQIKRLSEWSDGHKSYESTKDFYFRNEDEVKEFKLRVMML